MFDVFKRPDGTVLAGQYNTLAEAIAALQNRQSIVLPENFASSGVETVTTRGNSFYTNGGHLTLQLTPDSDLLYVYGDASVTVDAADVQSQIRLAGGDDVANGNDQRDYLYMGAGNDYAYGGDGDDRIYGEDGDDHLFAGTGSDKLYGGAGADTLSARDGNNQFYGGTGSDSYIFDTDGTGSSVIRDFSVSDGDQLTLTNFEAAHDLNTLIAQGIIRQSGDNVQVRYENMRVTLTNLTLDELAADSIQYETTEEPPVFFDVDAFLASGIYDETGAVTIEGVTYRMRDAEPLHRDHKVQDSNGDWWSPDYLVVVAAGQSNMKGAAKGGDFTIHSNVVAYDWVNQELVQASYGAAPAGGLGVRSGTTQINNLYFPFANELAETSGQPVLVIARPVSGSPIETWLAADRDWSTPSWEASENWNALVPDIEAALAAIGQTKIDSFLWHQGEGNSRVATADYVAMIEELVAQVRDTSWGHDELPFLLGELSRRGVLFQQNEALQEIELTGTDPYIGVVSSAGLTPSDPSGVHFDGLSLNEFGARYFDTYTRVLGEIDGTVAPEAANTAPTLNTDAAVPETLTFSEGSTVTIDVSTWFADAEGDALYYYTYLDDKKAWWADPDQATDTLILKPGYDDAGTYTITVYANDYRLDGESVSFDLVIEDATPTIDVYSNQNFDRYEESYQDLTTVMDGAQRHRGVDILDQSALRFGLNEISLETLRIRADATIHGDFILADDISRVEFFGQGDFNATGNALNNNIKGNDVANDIWGLDGADQLNGGAGDDQLYGGAGADKLTGGDGNDLLVGGTGNDKAYGEAGADTFVFAKGDTFLDVFDFDHAGEGDILKLSGLDGVTDYASLTASGALTEGNGRVILTFADERIFLRDVTLADVSSDMFDFV